MHLEKVEFNPLVQQDVKNMLSYFDQISDIVGNKVFEDFTNRIDQISKNPYQVSSISNDLSQSAIKTLSI